MATSNYGFINERSSLKTDPIRNFRYVVKFIPLSGKGPKFSSSLGFTAVSGLSMSTTPIPYREGGMNTTLHMIPGQSDFSPVNLTRGVTLGAKQHWDWLAKTFNASDPGRDGVKAAEISVTGDFRCDVRISVLAHPIPLFDADGSTSEKAGNNSVVVQRFRLRNAWPTTITYSDLNAGDSGILVEAMTLVHEGLAVDWAKDTNSYLPIWGD